MCLSLSLFKKVTQLPLLIDNHIINNNNIDYINVNNINYVNITISIKYWLSFIKHQSHIIQVSISTVFQPVREIAMH